MNWNDGSEDYNKIFELRRQVAQLKETVSQQAHELTLHVRHERELEKLLTVECTCRWIEMCDRCEAIDDYRAKSK